ncbi:MAG: pentapeptide repeat-containing protein [Magnetococcales bacterium]|nr:pentapeptide repeat-containing protein [Magnetococcales bacterium]
MKKFFAEKASILLEYIAKQFVELKKEKQEGITQIEKIAGPLDYLAPFYVMPYGQNINPADHSEDDTGLVAKNHVLDLLERFFMKQQHYSHTFVLSDAGMGKSSLLAMIKLFTLSGYIETDFNIDLLKLGVTTVEDISNIKNPSRTILLLDALDEDPEAWQSFHNRLLLLLQATQSFVKVVITCRTQFFPSDFEEDGRVPGQINLGGFYCSKLFLSPFDDYQVDEYLSKRFTIKEDRDKAKMIVSKMHSLKFRPMLLSYIDFLLEHDREYSNSYDLYEALVDEWINRELRKGFVKDKKTLENVCIMIAKEMYINKEREFDFEKLRDTYKNSEGVREFSYLTIEGRSLLHVTSEGKYKFAHYSILEFLVSKHIINGNLTCKNTDQVKSFISDLITFRNERNLSKIDLSSINLQDTSVKGVNFAYCDLTSSKFINLDLSNSTFKGAILENSVIENCLIVKSNFRTAKFHKLKLINSNLMKTNFKGCNISGSILNNNNLESSVLDGANLSDSQMQQCKFMNGSWNGVKFTNSNLDKSNFTDATILQASFLRSNISGVIFDRLNADNVDFMFVKGFGALFHHAIISSSQFDEGKLESFDFSYASFNNTSFRVANITNSKFINCEHIGSDFSGSKISDSTFSSSLLESSNFTKSKISNTSFSHANLSESIFNNSTITMAKFDSSIMNGLSFSSSRIIKSVFSSNEILNINIDDCIFKNCTFEYIVYDNTSISEPIFDSCSFMHIKYLNCTINNFILQDGKILNAIIKNCRFRKSKYVNSNIFDTEIHNTDFEGSSLMNSKFNGSKISNTNFSNCDISGTDFSDVQISNCKWNLTEYDERTIWPLGFNNTSILAIGPGCIVSNISSERFRTRGRNFSKAVFTDVNFFKADFTESILIGTRFVNCNLTGARFINTKMKGVFFSVNCLMENTIIDDDTLRHSDKHPVTGKQLFHSNDA